MVNPFLVETDEPDYPVTSNVPRSISPMNDLGPHNLPRLSTPPMQSRDFALPSADPPPTSVHDEANLLAERLKDMEIEMSHLKQERDEARNSARFYNQEGSRLRDYREATHGTSSTFMNEHPRSKIKPSDLPKFYGKDNEDVDEWIEKVSAIFTYSRARDIDFLRILPLLLHGNASEWFTTLGEEGRARLTSWDSWKAALRNGFYLPDHEMTKQMLCRNRTLKRTETFGDYFQSRRALQRYVYPPGTSDKVLIKDIMEGIPQHLHPIIRANSIGVRNIEDFRRVLIDLEPGIRDSRAYSPQVARSAITYRGAVNKINAPLARGKESKNFVRDKDSRSLPKTPCRCGEMHWYTDCPLKKKVASVNYAAKKEPSSFPNNVPLGKTVRWKSWDKKKEQDSQKDVNAIQTRSKRKQTAKPSVTTPAVAPSVELHLTPPRESSNDESEICPTFAIAKIDKDNGMLHKICIDTGSSISCIDYDYVKRHLPNHEIETTSNLRLMGVGTNMTTGTVQVAMHLVTNNPDVPYHRDVTLYVVPRLNTKIILGNDQLVPMRAQIDLQTNTMTFANHDKQVVISSTRKSDNLQLRKTARTREVFSIDPGYQARVPIVLDGTPPGKSYYLDASEPIQDLYVARSVATSDTDFHYALLCNMGRSTIKIPAGTLVGHPSGVSQRNRQIQEVTLLKTKARPTLISRRTSQSSISIQH